jgi:hypothetical protein
MWYGINLLFKSIHDPATSENEPLWEESILLIEAASEEEARQTGARLGRSKNHEYISASGDLVKWRFEKVESVCEILDDTISSGTEVFSRFLRESEVESILTPFKD